MTYNIQIVHDASQKERNQIQTQTSTKKLMHWPLQGLVHNTGKPKKNKQFSIQVTQLNLAFGAKSSNKASFASTNL
jgi:hypothetical protein